MNQLANELKTAILGCDPYDSSNALRRVSDVSGGEIYLVFEDIINNVQPSLILEIGTWKGKSAIHMTNLAKKYCEDVITICVDTWLGSDMVHQFAYKDDKTWGMQGMYNRGYPTVYFQFLSNVINAGLQDNIIPFPNTTYVAGQWFAQQPQLRPDVIYIDACHGEDECYLDLKYFWPILQPGGVMFGDDFDPTWYPVICAVNRFVRENSLKLMIAEGNKWVIQKTV
jgi:hypothetical protein